MSDDQTQQIMFCEGCGEAVIVNLEDGATTKSRRTHTADPAAGQVTITQGPDATVVHECAAGTFVPPERRASPRR